MTGEDVRDLLPLYALGILDEVEAGVVERAVASDPSLAAELRGFQDAAGALVAPIDPSPDVHARLVASVGGGRFQPFAERTAKLFEVSVARAQELLGLIERASSWEPQIPGIALVHFEGGPTYAAADCGFIRVAAGAMFPPHKHLGEEAVIILAGQIRDMKNGRLLGPGDDYIQTEGSDHYLVAEGPEDCIFAARAMNGIEVAGAPARPSKR